MKVDSSMGLSEDAIIQIRNVYKSFGHVEAVNNVSLDINRGEVTVIIGPSGSGKSTLLRCINHLESVDKGIIVVDGIPLNSKTNINRVRAEVGIVFQQFNLFPHLSVMQNIMLPQLVVRKRSRPRQSASRTICWRKSEFRRRPPTIPANCLAGSNSA